MLFLVMYFCSVVVSSSAILYFAVLNSVVCNFSFEVLWFLAFVVYGVVILQFCSFGVL